ncbi:MAG: GNAT family N-acetyltransferase [Anaerolineae bacterium]
MAEDPYQMTVDDQPSREDNHAIEVGLEAYNIPRAGPYNFRPLSVFLRDAQGKIVGGLVGGTHWEWLHVELLWIDESLRGQDWGTRLLTAAEESARDRGCHAVHLDTMSFQALPFYQKLGYTVFGVLDNFPTGHKRYYLQKQLAGAGEAK